MLPLFKKPAVEWRDNTPSLVTGRVHWRECDSLAHTSLHFTISNACLHWDPFDKDRLAESAWLVMSRSTDPDHFFQTAHSEQERKRREVKAKNEHGRPIRLQSKILAVIADPRDLGAIYVAQSNGTAKRIKLEVGEETMIFIRNRICPLLLIPMSFFHASPANLNDAYTLFDLDGYLLKDLSRSWSPNNLPCLEFRRQDPLRRLLG